MNAMMPDRRGLLRGALAVAAVGAMSRSQAEAQQQTEVHWSVGDGAAEDQSTVECDRLPLPHL